MSKHRTDAVTAQLVEDILERMRVYHEDTKDDAKLVAVICDLYASMCVWMDVDFHRCVLHLAKRYDFHKQMMQDNDGEELH